MSLSAAPLIDYLRELEGRGQKYVNVDDEARKILRAFYMRARAGTGSSVQQTQSKDEVAQVDVPPAVKVSNKPVANFADVEPVQDKQAGELVASGSSKKEQIASLKRQVVKWPAVSALTNLRKTMVFSVGNPDADIMLIGEAPGYDEERLAEPFVGKAGQKLDGILKAMGVDRKNAYITNIVKYRPAMPNQTTNNRQPTGLELEAFLPFIRKEIEVVAPKVIIALGVTSAQTLLASNESVASLRGKFHQFNAIPLRVSFHPSYILQNEATSEKRKIWEDMLAVMDLLKMPINEKQRGFFT
ncbi:MAG: uracil-DNA glycosylase [Akkermansiaceae bacterium]|nr:uracil-DNA glycosylase [Akkermansiaceae bacterium]